MNFYELISEIEASRLEHHWDNLPYSFNQSNRAKLESDVDFEIYDLCMKAYEINIIYRSERRDNDSKLEYRKYGDAGITPFTDTDLQILNNLDWTRLSHNLHAHIYDVIWLANKRFCSSKNGS